ncbi:titin homolog isoform X2 [Homalodisca vitripennis]|uniref:titin homolog isoform X2 n=1 Tax=Homalodisca vitripennis TaxID=197043 RepID=UPI001EEA3D8A|nr:titin homolog isoform X2 [Homalodisca vitripennis]
MKTMAFLKSKFKEPINNTRSIWFENISSISDTFEELDFILHCVQNNLITIKSKGNEKTDENAVNEDKNHDEVFKLPVVGEKKKRGRPIKQSTASVTRDSDSGLLDDSVSSSTSSKSRRAAAQAAGQKLAQVQSFMKATKLRRPTDFDDKQAKCRKTRQKQSAGSSREGGDDQMQNDNLMIDEQVVNGYNVQVCEVVLERINTPTIKLFTKNRAESSSSSSREDEDEPVQTEALVNGEKVVNDHELQNCKVTLERISTPRVKSLTRNRGKSKSLERTSRKRTSADLFNDSAPLLEANNKLESKTPSPSVKSKKNKNQVEKGIDTVNGNNEQRRTKRFKSSTSSNDNPVEQEGLPIAHSSPLLCQSPTTDVVFNGFDSKLENNPTIKCSTFVKQEIDESENPDSQTKVKKETDEISVIINTKTKKSRNKLLKKKENQLKTEEKENINRNNITLTLSDELNEESSEETTNTKSRTRVLRKKDQTEGKDEEDRNNRNNKNKTTTIVQQQDESPNVRSRTRVIKKADEGTTQIINSDDNNVIELVIDDSPEMNIRSRTKTLKKKTGDSPEAESNTRSRTRTIKKVPQTDNIEENNAKYLASQFKEPLEDANRQNKRLVPEPPPRSPAPKGELVKKRVEDFEKMKNGEIIDEEQPSRVTRNAAKNKPAPSVSSEPKLTRNVPLTKLLGSASKQQKTPISTPGFDSVSRMQVVNKFPHGTNRMTPADNNKALVHKQSAEEAEKKRKEEDHTKRQAKEEDAKKKKEKTLKATAEETRRKREEKLQKAAEARAAAEREKALLAVKLEKEKEDKMRLIAAEKEKQKEEQLKKKLLMQQKTLEYEERRRQEEAARLAKIKEQEEEHRRILAMKEREQELLQKQQKAAELRLAETEKAKQQGNSKLGKIAAVNNAKMKLQLGMTPSEKTNNVPTQSYEITPAREDRPLLKPKTEDDYGLDDAHSDDSSDEETCPKKEIPRWALPKNRERLIKTTKYIPSSLWVQFMVPNVNPDLSKMFAGTQIKKRIRTSSAVWRTPPRCSHFQK